MDSVQKASCEDLGVAFLYVGDGLVDVDDGTGVDVILQADLPEGGVIRIEGLLLPVQGDDEADDLAFGDRRRSFLQH